VNPCGEIPIPGYGACCLGSLNLNAFVLPERRFDWAKLHHHVNHAIHFMDRLIDLGYYPVPEIAAFEAKYRPLGLGVMGLADVLAKLGFPYNSVGGHRFVSNLFKTIREMADIASGGGNATVLSVAPTGTISMLAGCSYSIEPFFALAYNKVVTAGVFPVLEPTLLSVLEDIGITLTDEEIQQVQETGSLQWCERIPEEVRQLFLTAPELHWRDHLQMQATVQTWVDNAVSKTINLPADATQEDIRDIIYRAHQLGLKGLTVYRDRSRQTEVIQSCASGTCNL